jgi:hypothetical protein
VPCDAGTYSAAAGASAASTCVECGAGKFSETTGAAAESACFEIATCVPGQFWDAGARACVECAEGEFQAVGPFFAAVL